MTRNNQERLRFIIPGVMLYGISVIFCWATQWCSLATPTNLTEISTLVAPLVLGFIYAVSGLREMSNKFYHKRVNVNICHLLTQPFIKSNPELLHITWREIRPLFYNYIDNDKSLEKQSEIIMWNGLLWTSAADLRACCFLGALFLSIAIVCGYQIDHLAFDLRRAGYVITGLLIMILLSFVWSANLTKRHRRLGEEQCEYMIVHYRSDLLGKLKSAAGTAYEGS